MQSNLDALHSVNVGKAKVKKRVDVLRAHPLDKTADGGVRPRAFVVEHVLFYKMANRVDLRVGKF